MLHPHNAKASLSSAKPAVTPHRTIAASISRPGWERSS